jgi:hypothetical protein
VNAKKGFKEKSILLAASSVFKQIVVPVQSNKALPKRERKVHHVGCREEKENKMRYREGRDALSQCSSDGIAGVAGERMRRLIKII